jgi:hypothetical protein
MSSVDWGLADTFYVGLLIQLAAFPKTPGNEQAITDAIYILEKMRGEGKPFAGPVSERPSVDKLIASWDRDEYPKYHAGLLALMKAIAPTTREVDLPRIEPSFHITAKKDEMAKGVPKSPSASGTLLKTNLSATPYVYKPLPTSTSIRVLNFTGLSGPIPTDIEKDSPLISVTMRTIDLADEPAFDALSYTWGMPRLLYSSYEEIDDPKSSYDRCWPIICDGQLLKVTKNGLQSLMLSAAAQGGLNHLAAERGVEPQTFSLWMDAICINQEDVQERNAQVELMEDIYKKAAHVQVWLGKEEWFTAPAERTFQSVYQAMTRFRRADLTAVDIFDRAWWLEHELPDPGDWIGFYVYLQHSWFRRSWVVQEVALASKINVYCGHFLVSASALATSYAFLQRNGWLNQLEKVRKSCFYGMCNSGRESYYLQEAVKNKSFMFGEAQSLPTPPELKRAALSCPADQQETLPALPAIMLYSFGNPDSVFSAPTTHRAPPSMFAYILRQILWQCRSFEASQPHDNVYAFLSVAESLIEPRAVSQRPIRVEYDKPVHQVYTEVVALILSYTANLMDRYTEILWQVEDKSVRNIDKLPSWVPDFSTKSFPKGFEDLSRGWNTWPLSYRPSRIPTVKGSDISTSGVLVDTIVDVAAMEGDPLMNAVKVALGLPKIYRTSTRPGQSQEEGQEEGQEGSPSEQVLDEFTQRITSAQFASSMKIEDMSSQRKATTDGSSPSSLSYFDDAQRPMLQALGLQHSHNDFAMYSPRRQTRVEALWRTLLLDYCSKYSPAPIEAGFAFGDWILRRIEEAHTLYLLLRDAPSEQKLKDELELWADLTTCEPNESMVALAWPAISETAGETLLQYVSIETTARACLQGTVAGSQPDYQTVISMATAAQLPSIRYLPNMAAIERYLRFRTVGIDIPGESSTNSQSLTHGTELEERSCEDQISPQMKPLEQQDSRERKDGKSESSSSAPLRPPSPLEDETAPFIPKDQRARQSEFFSQYNEYNAGRRVFRTAQGWLGNGHQSAQPGDEVWLIPQCTVPMILRPLANGKYSMVGVCYVHGMMFRAEVRDEWVKVVDDILIS